MSMTFLQALAIARNNGEDFVEGFVKCTYVRLYDRKGEYLFTIQHEYSAFPGITFTKENDNWLDRSARKNVPILRAYNTYENKGFTEVYLSDELRYAVQYLLEHSKKIASEPWKLYREYKQDTEDYRKGDTQLLAVQYDMPENVEAGEMVIKETDIYTEYWTAPPYEATQESKYAKLLEIIANGEAVMVKETAINWYADTHVVTTISDNILTDNNGDILIDPETGEPAKLYDEYGNEIETDINGKPLFPPEVITPIGTEALATAKAKLDQAKAVLAAAGAITIL